ncbi:MAG: hypothetical protein GX962_02850 [Epulopiscium sp.]|nr:hypothetical protein [Candidatus Epulonipiscium sp.]
MNNPVNQYLYAKEEVFSYFGCAPDYFLNDLREMYWKIQHKEGFSVLTFSEQKDFNTSSDVVIVKQAGKLMIYETKEYTLCIAIQCVKVGLIFKNANRIE